MHESNWTKFWFKTFTCIMKNWSDLKLMKRGFIKNQKLLVDNQVAALRLSSDVNDERCFSPSFFVFHSFSILWFSARAKLMSPVSSPAHNTTFIPHFHDYLTLLFNRMFEKFIVQISKHLFDTFMKNQKKVLHSLLLWTQYGKCFWDLFFNLHAIVNSLTIERRQLSEL